VAANEALRSVLNAWGASHAYHGSGIRKLGSKLFECRAGLRLRLLFQPNARERELIFFEIGSHDQIRRLLGNW
jgi:mRNA-degrading endonuclease YafQ of YafQ-DinJ toxin-antitoxin module